MKRGDIMKDKQCAIYMRVGKAEQLTPTDLQVELAKKEREAILEYLHKNIGRTKAKSE